MRLIDLFSREEFTHLLLLSSFHHSCRCSTMGKTKKQQSVVAKKKMKMTYDFSKSIDHDSNSDLLDIVKNLKYCNINQLLAFHRLIVDKESDKTDAKYICEECQKEGCRLYCMWEKPSVILSNQQLKRMKATLLQPVLQVPCI